MTPKLRLISAGIPRGFVWLTSQRVESRKRQVRRRT